MEEFSPKRRVLATLLGGKVDRKPVTSVAGCAGTVSIDMQKAGGVYLPEAHKDAQSMAKLALLGAELTGIECVRVPFDFVVEPEALGCEIKWENKAESVPAVMGHPYKSPEDLKKPEKLLEMGRIPVILDSIRILRREVGDRLPIASTALGPYTIAGELAGIDNIMKWLMQKPGYVRDFIAFAKGITIEFAKAQYQAGSDIVQVAEPLASLSMLSPLRPPPPSSARIFREFLKSPLSEVARSLGGLRVLHICGETRGIETDMAETGFDGISIEAVDVAHVKSIVGDVKILGNVSSSKTLMFGSPDDVKAEARKSLNEGVDLLEPTCGIPLTAPLENVKAMVEEAES